MTKAKEALSKSVAIDKLWRNGVLSWKLDSCQKKLQAVYHDSKYRKIVWKCSRRLGKSHALLIIALERAIKHPGSQIKYACPTAVMAQKIIIPTIRKILADCPEDLKPNYVRAEKCFYFKNESVIQIEGTDEGNAEKLRGTESHLSILDEAGFMDDLEYVINDILLPQTFTTRGKIIMSSTPPKKPDHAYNKFAAEAKLNDAYIMKTILDAVEETKNDPEHFKSRFHLDILEEIKESMGGEDSASWQREFLCRDIVSDERLVIPEFNEQSEAKLVCNWPRPKYVDSYVGMDIGFIDFTGILFGYLDFENQKLIIEDEVLLNGMKTTSSAIAENCHAKEAALWTHPDTKVFNPPYLRVSDDELVVLQELRLNYKINFIPTKKDNKEASIDDVRNKIRAEKILIHPRCKNLIFQLKTATWAKNKRTFERTQNDGHYDLVDALIYLVRNVQWQKNPRGVLSRAVPFDVFDRGAQALSATADSVKTMMGMQRTNKK